MVRHGLGVLYPSNGGTWHGKSVRKCRCCIFNTISGWCLFPTRIRQNRTETGTSGTYYLLMKRLVV